MGQALERAVRWFVAEGCGLKSDLVIPGDDDKGQRPKAPYASLLLLDDRRKGYPIRRHIPDGEAGAGRVADMIYRRAEFSLQFYRKGAVDMAERFDAWAMSPRGLMQAETAFPDGRLERVRVYSGGTGYTSAPAVEFEDMWGSGATATASVVGGAVTGVVMTARGKDFTDTPVIRFVGGGNPTEDATASAYGYGFSVLFPLEVQRLDGIAGDGFEERALITLPIDYARWDSQDVGHIDSVECTVIVSGIPKDDPEGEVVLADEKTEAGLISIGSSP